MLFFTLLIAVLVVFSSAAKIFEEDRLRPAVTQAMVDEINVSIWHRFLILPSWSK
jgi:hypothetical protein